MATTTMATTTPALFRFSIHNSTSTTHLTHTHPIPTFLLHPTASQKASPAFTTAYIDVLTVITSQHHDSCMRALNTPCLSCSSPLTDCLKAPQAFLDLAEPLIVVHVYPVCGRKECEGAVRRGVLSQEQMREKAAEEEEGKIFGKMECAVCGKGNAKRCAGCGTVGYCGKECQAVGWKAHRRDCRRGYKPRKEGDEGKGKGIDVPYETI